jgi:hypothetical protein
MPNSVEGKVVRVDTVYADMSIHFLKKGVIYNRRNRRVGSDRTGKRSISTDFFID